MRWSRSNASRSDPPARSSASRCGRSQAPVARREELAQQRETVAVIGGTGALGFGLGLRWALAGVRIVIGSRSPERAAEAAGRLREQARSAGAESVEVEGLENAEA